jgi:hypothetical protein
MPARLNSAMSEPLFVACCVSVIIRTLMPFLCKVKISSLSSLHVIVNTQMSMDDLVCLRNWQNRTKLVLSCENWQCERRHLSP